MVHPRLQGLIKAQIKGDKLIQHLIQFGKTDKQFILINIISVLQSLLPDNCKDRQAPPITLYRKFSAL